MKNLGKSRRLSFLLAVIMAISTIFGSVPLMNGYAYTEKAAVVNATTLNVRSGPGTSYSIAGKLYMGAPVTVIGEQNGADGARWYQIRFSGSSTGYALASYIKFPVAYTTDSDFESHLSSEGFPESYKVKLRQLHAEYPSWVFRAQHTNLDWNTVIQNESVVARNLVHKSSASSWKSIADGAYNWDTGTWPGFDGSAWVAASEDVIRYHMDPRNFLDSTYVFQFILQSYDSSAHTAEGVRSMIKGTFLEGSASGGGGVAETTPGVSSGNTSESNSGGNNSGTNSGTDSGSGFVNSGPGVAGGSQNNQGSSSGGSSSGGSISGGTLTNEAPSSRPSPGYKLQGPIASISKKNVDVVAAGTFGPGMTEGNQNSGSSETSAASPETGNSSIPYVDLIMKAGAQSGVNPYVLAAMIIQEQGSNGSPSVSGTVSGYEGIYNFYNIGAFQSGNLSATQKGLTYATQSGTYGRPWNSVERSIVGGAQYYGETYVKAGQDTFYLKKFNVQGSNLYKHQYMTNIQGAASEGALYAKAYSDEMKKTALEFKIPVYTNMPADNCPRPLGDGSPNNKLSGISVDGFSLTPTYNRDTLEYNLIVDASVTSINLKASAIDSTASVSGTGSIQLQGGTNDIRITVKAQNGSERVYVIHVVRQDNGATYIGDGNSSGSSDSGQSGPIGPGGASGPGGM